MRESRGSWPTPEQVAARQAELGLVMARPKSHDDYFAKGAELAADPALDLDDPLDDPEALRAAVKARSPAAVAAGRQLPK